MRVRCCLLGAAMLLGGTTLVGCTNTNKSSTLDAIRARGTLTFGADIQGGEPYVFENPDLPGELAGFEVEIAVALGRELGVKAELVQNDWSTLIPSLEHGSFDVILNGLEITRARQDRILFTRPYYRFQEELVTRTGEQGASDLGSLAGRRVGTLANSLAWDLLESTGAVRVPYEGVEEPFIDLVQRRTDAVLLDDIIVARYGNKPGLRVAANVGEGSYAIGLRQGDTALLQALDGALEKLERSGELDTILVRWQLEPLGKAAASAPTPSAVAAAPAPKAAFALTPHQWRLFLEGAGVTLLVSSAAMLLAITLGLLLAVLRMPSPSRLRGVVGRLATGYVELFRGTPVMLQLYALYYGLADVVALEPFTAAILALGLNYAAYEAEVYRAGIQAVPRGQVEAAAALGMSMALTLRRVILPQAVRFSLPGVANDFIALLKDSSLVSVITVVELTKRMTIAAVDGRSWLLPGVLAAGLYLGMSYPLSRLARRLETKLGAPL